MAERVYTVSEISQEVRRVIERYFAPIWVRGEVSNLSLARSGHVYFALKDQNALINCVIWRNIANSIPFEIANGMQLLVYGTLTTYALQSQYQITVQKVQAAGLGDLYIAYEALKQKLAAEGLFDPTRKRPLPQFPRTLGLITSISGAAVQDFLQISERRNPAVEIQIYPAQVQGEGAAETIVAGLDYFNRQREVDLIVIARGGGSIEDLWTFNEEKVVRAIAASQLPVVSAIGHEVDYTLADFAADLRAPTPSAAAELVIPDREQILQKIDVLLTGCRRALSSQWQLYLSTLQRYQERLLACKPINLVLLRRQRLDELDLRLRRWWTNTLERWNDKLQSIRQTMMVLDPRSILQRGYAIVYAEETGKMIKTITMVDKEAQVNIELYDGRFKAKVEQKWASKNPYTGGHSDG